MTRRPLLLVSLAAVVLLALLLLWRGRTAAPDRRAGAEPKAPPSVDVERLQVNGLKVVGLAQGRERDQLRSLSVVNRRSPEWKEGLVSTLRAQGGSDLTDVRLNVVDSFVWIHDGLGLFVESVIVTIKNERNHETTFRVLVDAQNGKILQNWDQPVVDPATPQESFRLKLDPRYHAE
jgi:hypothetical protein